jgi:ABC-type polar amino acid transport system ATPase subunit
MVYISRIDLTRTKMILVAFVKKRVILIIRRNINIHNVIVICGLPGVGKTTLAKEIAPLVNAVLL